MTERQQSFDQLLTSIEERERSSRRNALLWTLVPIVAAVALLGYSSWRLAAASKEVAALANQATAHKQEAAKARREADRLNKQNGVMREQLTETEELLHQTLEFSRFRFDLDPVDIKAISSRNPAEAGVLRFIIEMRERDVDWKLGGHSPQEGFDSPSFAEFVLRRFDRASGDATEGLSLIAASRRLFETLPATDDPKPGDLAFYPSGYVMFYYLSEGGEPFVIGMTPFGIASFRHDFARVIGFRRPANSG